MSQQRSDIGFTFTQVGETTLPNGKKVPKLDGRPNNPEAHRALIEAVRRENEEDGYSRSSS